MQKKTRQTKKRHGKVRKDKASIVIDKLYIGLDYRHRRQRQGTKNTNIALMT